MPKRRWVAFLVLLAWAAIPMPAGAQLRAVTLTSAVGATTVRLRGTTEYVRATRGMPLSAGDIVRTGPTGGAVLLFPDGSSIKVRANSAVVIPLIGASGAPERVRLEQGRIFSRLRRGQRARFEAGRTAVAGVRGTEFDLELDADETATLTVVEGEVDFATEQGAVLVGPSQQSVARLGQAPTPPIVVDPSGIIAWEASVESLAFPIETPTVPPGEDLDRLLRRRERAAVLLSGDASTLLALADVRQDLGRLREAAEAYDRTFALLDASPPAGGDARQIALRARANRAHLALREGDVEAARAAFERLAAAYPRSPEGPLGLGMAHLATGDVPRAVPHLQEAAALDPQGARPPTFLAVARLRQADVAGAAELLREALARDERYYPAHAYLAYALTLQGEVDAAVGSARRAVALAPHSALAREALAQALLYANEPEAAAREVQRALEINPLSAPARLTQARVLVATDRLEEGVTAARQAVALDPRSAVARSTLGTLLLARGDPEEAEREFRRALELAPNLATAQSGLGAVFARRGQLAQALARQKAALALDSTSSAAHNNLGAVYLARGQLGAAIAAFRQAIALQPRWGLPYANLAQAYLEENRFAEAVAAGETAVRLGEESAVLRTTLARVYARQQRLDRALAELRQAEALDPDYPQAQFQLSRIYLEQERNRDALKSILRGTSVHPGAMVEDRLYARTEAGLAAGEVGQWQLDGKTDGRALNARLSYFASGSGREEDGERENADERQRFGLGLVGYERSAAGQWLAYGSWLERKNGRPGRQIGGATEDPNFRGEFDGWEGHLVRRVRTGLRSFVTLKLGTRDGELLDRNPDSLFPDPLTAVDRKPFRRLETRLEERLAEGRWDTVVTPRDRVIAGFAWREQERRITGELGTFDPTRTPVFQRETTRFREDATLRTFYLEWLHRAGDRLDLKLGGYLDRSSGIDSLALPKVVARYRPAGRSYLVFLAYPTFPSDATELSPVEAWAQPFGFEQLGFARDGWAMSYELHYERPMSRLSLLSLSVFSRHARGLLLDLEDPELAPAPTPLPVARARVSGAQAALERTLGRAWTARLFARWQDSEDRRADRDLPYFPRWQGGVRLDYLDRAGWRCFAAATWPGSRFADGENRQELGGYTVIDLRIARQLNLRQFLFVQIENLLDREYEEFAGYPAPGRRIVGGVERRF